MLFNSFEFLVFFVTVLVIYYILPHRFRWILLLVSSYFFYGYWEWKYLAIILISTLVDFIAGIQIYQATSSLRKHLFLYISILSNLGILMTFKYYNFFIENINYACNSYYPYLEFLLPVGISFYTFQTMSYSIDLYNGRLTAPEKHFGRFALFVTFFPQLVAGPIERASHLLPQFRSKITFNYDNLSKGLSLILWGLFKKVVIADRLALLVDEVYNNVGEYNGPAFILATLFFTFQIYCDFSGYSDIAIGTAKTLGFNLNINFNKPYLSKSIRDFWKRWHISLSSWFRDYVYIPLGGNKVVKWRWYYNLFLTFLVSGLWHGANWTFIIWGSIHGFVLILEYQFFKKAELKNSLKSALQLIVTFSIICFSWIFFRSNSLSDAQHIIKELINFENYNLSQFSLNIIPVAKDTVYPIDIAIGCLVIIFLVLAEIIFSKYNFFELSKKIKTPIYIIGIISLFVLGVFNTNAFIYFQF